MATPEVDMLAVSARSRKTRRAILGFAPRIGLSIVDYTETERSDNFYLECQNYRDYYRDPYNKLNKPDRFKLHQGRCGIKLDKSVEELMKPADWVTERQPVVYPIEYRSYMNLGIGFEEIFKGRFDKDSCVRYKR
ncbi:CG43796 [Drosophila busckii]|uniref:CG43796 n=1 Tax=Drosophila busckii TaxID=30019 RepID=A0A0M5J3V4_DROBS|nr:uncharacterized protein LOC108603663 [Drosophila busckii]ALC39256.1 CG43796 [Drosophila busckii]